MDPGGGGQALASEVGRAAAEPVLRTDLFLWPIIVESLELLCNGEEILVRARSRDGAKG